MRTYRTLYPNHVHQLSVSVSKHYYAGKDGLLKYQKEPFKVSLDKLSEAKKNHMVIYSLRDHTSGLYYTEIAFAPTLIPIKDFLRRAWQPKPDIALHGLPDYISLPKTIVATFPETERLILELDIVVGEAESGFKSGAPIASKALESQLGFYIGRPIREAPEGARRVCQFNDSSKGRTGGETKAEMWRRSDRQVRLLPAIF